MTARCPTASVCTRDGCMFEFPWTNHHYDHYFSSSCLDKKKCDVELSYLTCNVLNVTSNYIFSAYFDTYL